MGIGEVLRRISLFGLFAALAVYSFFLSSQLGGIEHGKLRDSSIELLRKEKLRQDLVGAVNDVGQQHLEADWRVLAQLEPTDPLPFELALIKTIEDENWARASTFAEETLRRQPRSLAARLYLFRYAALQQDFEMLLLHYDQLVELRSLNSDILSDALIGVFREAGNWTALLEYLNTHPTSGRLLVRKLMSEPIESDDFEPVVMQYIDSRGQYLRRLAERKYYEQAHAAWLSVVSADKKYNDTVPFNHEFHERVEPEPFNWKIHSPRAEFHPQGGLNATYLGDKKRLIVEQTFRTASGSQRLIIRARGRLSKNGGSFAWVISCLPDAEELLSEKLLLSKNDLYETMDAPLAIPEENCTFGKIQLWGIPGEFPKTSRIQIQSVKLVSMMNGPEPNAQ